MERFKTKKKKKTCVQRSNLPLTVFQKILEGALKWKGPRAGFTLQRLRRNDKYFSLFLQKQTELFNCNWEKYGTYL